MVRKKVVGFTKNEYRISWKNSRINGYKIFKKMGIVVTEQIESLKK